MIHPERLAIEAHRLTMTAHKHFWKLLCQCKRTKKPFSPVILLTLQTASVFGFTRNSVLEGEIVLLVFVVRTDTCCCVCQLNKQLAQECNISGLSSLWRWINVQFSVRFLFLTYLTVGNLYGLFTDFLGFYKENKCSSFCIYCRCVFVHTFQIPKELQQQCLLFLVVFTAMSFTLVSYESRLEVNRDTVMISKMALHGFLCLHVHFVI